MASHSFVSRFLPIFFPDPKYHDEPVTCFGLTFPNRIGLAAGLDKNAECVKAWQSMGFGFVEVGTVTPLAQLGNEKPRLFRLRQDKAIINRLGFNNAGIDALVEKLNQVKRFCPIGINIGKNLIRPKGRLRYPYI